MKCVIVDDEATALAILENLCKKTEDLELLSAFSEASQALSFLQTNVVDLVFLDIEMPGHSGFEVLEASGTSAQVILTTSHNTYADKSYEFANVAGYLVKPIDPERFAKAIQRVRNRLSLQTPAHADDKATNTEEMLSFKIDRSLVQVPVSEIIFVEAERDYVQIHTTRQVIRVHSSLKALMNELPLSRFLQIHRSFVANTQHINLFKRNSVSIHTYMLPVSRAYRQELLKRLGRT